MSGLRRIASLVAEVIATAIIGILVDRWLSTGHAILVLIICVALIVWHHWAEIHPVYGEVLAWARPHPIRFSVAFAILIFLITVIALGYQRHWYALSVDARKIPVVQFPDKGRPLFGVDELAEPQHVLTLPWEKPIERNQQGRQETQQPAPVISVDPYAGIPNTAVGTWAIQEAARLERDGGRCMNDEFQAWKWEQQKPPKDPGLTVRHVDWNFHIYFQDALRGPITKLHDSITLRLGPAALSPGEEEAYSEVIEASNSPTNSDPFLCMDVKEYASYLQELGQSLLNQP